MDLRRCKLIFEMIWNVLPWNVDCGDGIIKIWFINWLSGRFYFKCDLVINGCLDCECGVGQCGDIILRVLVAALEFHVLFSAIE